MTDSYYDKLLHAREFTTSLELSAPEIIPVSSEPYLTRPDFWSTIQEQLDFTRSEELYLKSNLVSILLTKIIESSFNCRTYLTIGNLVHNDGPVFRISESYVCDVIQSGVITDPDYSHHAWVTLETMEIIDLTFLTSIARTPGKFSNTNKADYIGRVVTGDAETLADQGIHYLPVMVGEDFYDTFDPSYQLLKNGYFAAMYVKYPSLESYIQKPPNHPA